YRRFLQRRSAGSGKDRAGGGVPGTVGNGSGEYSPRTQRRTSADGAGPRGPGDGGEGHPCEAVKGGCRANGGFYRGSVGGPAARLAQDCIRKVDVLEYPELGMEAVWRIGVENFPAFIVID